MFSDETCNDAFTEVERHDEAPDGGGADDRGEDGSETLGDGCLTQTILQRNVR
jgi:hypothetical protein